MPAFEPTNSPTTAPTTASVTETFSPLKIEGRAVGRRNLRNTLNGLAPMERARSITSDSTALKPCTVDTTTGKKPSRNAAITLGTMPKPNHTTKSGAIATLGTDCENTSSGYTKLSTTREYAIHIAMGTPTRADAAKPP